ncbi:unnamed protein product [Haemonchus placei]|uniref:Uncharacterized protein n=1 Tax=Haemonchus placei TaxID=6290 RepID=A0A3P7XQA4_HAEPC|nr:unnamed protein product [Haemonchus placei]
MPLCGNDFVSKSAPPVETSPIPTPTGAAVFFVTSARPLDRTACNVRPSDCLFSVAIRRKSMGPVTVVAFVKVGAGGRTGSGCVMEAFTILTAADAISILRSNVVGAEAGDISSSLRGRIGIDRTSPLSGGGKTVCMGRS